MFIQTESTPNPLTLKFLPGVEVMKSDTIFITTEEQAKTSPLAQSLFKVEGVSAVFFGSDFITVTKDDDSHWEALKPIILTTIMDHFVAGKPVMLEEKKAASNEGDTELEKQIRELIDTRVRPAVAQDGGDIVFHGFEDGIVKLELHGACSGCPSSTVTLKNGIENMLKHYVPEVVAVEAVA
ncbi:MAG: NifU family protein [Rickettsiales bacterium]